MLGVGRLTVDLTKNSLNINRLYRLECLFPQLLQLGYASTPLGTFQLSKCHLILQASKMPTFYRLFGGLCLQFDLDCIPLKFPPNTSSRQISVSFSLLVHMVARVGLTKCVSSFLRVCCSPQNCIGT